MPTTILSSIENFATCSPAGAGYTWRWETSPSSTHCRFTQRTEKQLKKKLDHKRLAFVGDSMTRNLYHSICRQMGIVNAGRYDTGGPKHIDIARVADKTNLDFIWAPLAVNQLDIMKELNENAMKRDMKKYDLVVMGGGAWDRLHRYQTPEDIRAHTDTLNAMKMQITAIEQFDVPIVWFTPTTINTPALTHTREEGTYE
mmetsp:Transcript_4073/g.6197  ORF Transcript_4073/g.6197 Transcript_4073/m.6197 type:complete len:200 (-) Transcript_4073:208-807(-)